MWTSVLSYLFGGVLLLGGVGPSQLVLHAVSVLEFFHLVNPDQPVLRREGFLQVLQLNVLVADLGVACPVEARRRPEVQLGGEFSSLKIKVSAEKKTQYNADFAGASPVRAYLHLSKAVVRHFVHKAIE